MTAITVYVVDDDAFIREVVAAALKGRPGVRVESFASGDAALERVRSAKPDLVVLDVQMPERDGLSIFQEMNAAVRSAPRVLFLTARDDAAHVARLREAGAVGVLTKPFDPSTIADEILKFHGAQAPAPAQDPRLGAVAARFISTLAPSMADIEKEWRLLEQEWRRDVAESLAARVHKLAGSAGLFKLRDLGRAARELESVLNRWLGGEAPDDEALVQTLGPAVEKLRAQIVAAVGSG